MLTERVCAQGHVGGYIVRSDRTICRPCAKEAMRRWSSRNPETVRANSAIGYEKRRTTLGGRVIQMLGGARARARLKGLEYNLSPEWLTPKLEKNQCELTGLPLETAIATKRQRPFSASLDRIDSSKGYTMDNTRLVAWAMNCALSNFGEEVFAKVARAYIAQRELT